MAFKRLFTEEETFNEDGQVYAGRINEAVTKIFKEYIDSGYSSIDLEQIALSTVQACASVNRLNRQVREKKRQGGGSR